MEAITKRIAIWFTIVFGLFVGGSGIADTPQMIFQLGIGSAVGPAAMSPDGAFIAIATGRGVALLDPKKGVILTHLAPPLQAPSKPQWISALAFSPDGRLLALGGASGEISIWNVRTATLVRTMQVPGPDSQVSSLQSNSHVSSLQFDRTGKRLMASRFYTVGPVMVVQFAVGSRALDTHPYLRQPAARLVRGSQLCFRASSAQPLGAFSCPCSF